MTRTIPIHPSKDTPNPAGLQGDGVGCHAGTEAMVAAAKEAGKSEVLDQYARDYPRQPGEFQLIEAQ